MKRRVVVGTLLGMLVPVAAGAFEITGTAGSGLQATEITSFDEPWAMTFLPDGDLLVTTKPGTLFLVGQDGTKTEVDGLWEVSYGGQGGLGDVVLHPDFASNNLVYISSIERSLRRSWAVVRRATLVRSADGVALADPEIIWEQSPRRGGDGHFSHRIAFSPDGMLFITSGDRRAREAAQSLDAAFGKVIRLHDDGSVPADNPWQDAGDLAKTFWSMGHRNLLGIAFDGDGRLWTHEMGPRHGDELNLIEPGVNYGWPEVSYGNHYSGARIPDHPERPEFVEPKAYWVPAISPAGLVIYDGAMFGDWQGDAFMGGLSGQALVRVDLNGETAAEAERFEWNKRIREVEQGPDGALWVLEDQDGGRLLKLTPG